MAFDYDVRKINDMILRYLPARDGLQATVFNAMGDAVIAGGKRIRPILMYETYKMFCKKNRKEIDDQAIAPFMAGMEIMHTASLIHDDLPCMDNDRLRRGQPTTWVVYGEDMATLTGDAMMIETFSLMGEAAMRSSDKEAAVKALYTMAMKSGLYGMTGGQVVDVENTGKPLDEEKLDFIYRLKTGALLEASMMIGAILGGADHEEIEKVEKIAADIGFAFQVRDDILDEISTDENLGKPIHSDAENNKTTYVTLFGIEKADQEVRKRSMEAEELLEALGGDTKVLKQIISYLIDRDK